MTATHIVRKKPGPYLHARYGVASDILLHGLAAKGEGPPFRRLGKKSFVYSVADLDSWAMAQGSETPGCLIAFIG